MAVYWRLRPAGGPADVTWKIPDPLAGLVRDGALAAAQGPAHHMGGTGHLLFEFAVACAASGPGDCFCGVCDLGPLDLAPASNARGCGPGVSGRGRMVAHHYSQGRTQLA